jgi:hypothetical protein
MIPFLFFCGVIAALLVLRLLMFRGVIGSGVSEPPRGIIDMHCHTAGIGAGGSGAWISDALRNSWKFGLYLKIFGSNEKAVTAEGDESLMEIIARSIQDSKFVDGAVILAMDAPYTAEGELNRAAGEVFVPNRFVGESVKISLSCILRRVCTRIGKMRWRNWSGRRKTARCW